MTTRTIHRIQVRYSAPVASCVRRLHVLPPHDECKVLCEQWQCDPTPDETRASLDDFGNRVLELRHRRIERDFRFELHFDAQYRPSQIACESALPPQGLGAFVLPSALCDLSPAIAALDATNNRGQAPEVRAAHFCSVVHNALRYDQAAGDIANTASGVLQRGVGVCQDFAHVMIALCRARSLPARYVAGYLIGQGQMHAWVEVLCNGVWRAFDPTHNRRVAEAYILVARGRDYRDVPTMEGHFRGAATAKLRTYCKTKRLL